MAKDQGRGAIPGLFRIHARAPVDRGGKRG